MSLIEQRLYAYGLTEATSVRFFILLAFCSFCIYRYGLTVVKYRADVEFGKRNGCRPPACVLSYKWPFALDVVKRGFKAGRQKRLLSLFTDYFDQLGPTVELTILGGVGFATMDPENIEAVLSTHFDGTSLAPALLRWLIGNSRLSPWASK